MRKILASFLAASMVASICATAAFAANTSAKKTFDFSTNLASTTTKIAVEVTRTSDTVLLGSSEVDVSGLTFAAANADGVLAAGALDGVKVTNILIDGRSYDLTLNDIAKVDGTGADLQLVFTPAAELREAVTVSFKQYNGTAKTWSGVGSGVSFAATDGVGGDMADITASGAIDVRDVILCDGQGYPIPLTENPKNQGNDINDEGGVQGSRTVYFLIKTDANKYDDEDYWKLRINKGDNAKYVKKVSDVSKNFSGDLYNVLNGNLYKGTGSGRHRYIKVELNDIYTDDEYKIGLDMRMTPTSKATDKLGVAEDVELKVKDFYFYMKNIVRNADNDWKVGINGLMLNPLSNDWNEVTWYDEEGDLAHMKFFADSDVSKFYSKLSTKWEHADYASYFNDQDAYIFDFTGSPKLSATSRADLEIYNPFVDEDGNETIDPETAVIYQVIDGDLFDITDNFEYKEADSGDMAFVTRTRFLGTYIICEKAIEEAADAEAPDTDLVPEEAPEEVTPGGNTNDGGKAPANTGRYA